MAKFDLKFLDQEMDEEKTLQVFFNPKENTNFKEDSIRLWIQDEGNFNIHTCFDLDKSTAIKFSKTLRTEINKIKDNDFERLSNTF